MLIYTLKMLILNSHFPEISDFLAPYIIHITSIYIDTTKREAKNFFKS